MVVGWGNCLKSSIYIIVYYNICYYIIFTVPFQAYYQWYAAYLRCCGYTCWGYYPSYCPVSYCSPCMPQCCNNHCCDHSKKKSKTCNNCCCCCDEDDKKSKKSKKKKKWRNDLFVCLSFVCHIGPNTESVARRRVHKMDFYECLYEVLSRCITIYWMLWWFYNKRHLGPSIMRLLTYFIAVIKFNVIRVDLLLMPGYILAFCFLHQCVIKNNKKYKTKYYLSLLYYLIIYIR